MFCTIVETFSPQRKLLTGRLIGREPDDSSGYAQSVSGRWGKRILTRPYITNSLSEKLGTTLDTRGRTHLRTIFISLWRCCNFNSVVAMEVLGS